MLGMLGLLILILGAFTAGGGIFNWEFFFSDGYREHGWSRSLGREGARGVLMLLGGVLALAGFVTQIVDAASKPVAIRAIAEAGAGAASNDAPAEGDNAETTSVPEIASHGQAFNRHPDTLEPPAGATRRPAPAAPSTKSRSSTTAAPPLGTMPSAQPVTIWSPDPAPEEMRIFLILQYRFEAGHQPQRGTQYDWVVELQGVAHKIAFDGATLEKQGQLTHLFDASGSGGGFNKPWSTWIEIGGGDEGRAISNRLEIKGTEVRSVPLATAP